MSVEIISGDNGAVFSCNTTDWAFGPKMHNQEEAEAFLKWLPDDPREYSESDLQYRYTEFIEKNVCECGNLRQSECIECKYDEPLNEHGMHGIGIACSIEPEPTEGRHRCAYCVLKIAA